MQIQGISSLRNEEDFQSKSNLWTFIPPPLLQQATSVCVPAGVNASTVVAHHPALP